MCQKCGRLAPNGAADHIVPRAEGGNDTIQNLQWLCAAGSDSCHSKKTREESRRGQRRRASSED